MEHVAWTTEPRLRNPVLVAAFEGWNDAGEAATLAAHFLARQWAARPFASIDPEEFYDFSSTRPRVHLEGGLTREIVWPANEFSAASVPGANLDVVVLVGVEPQLKWRTFCAQVVGVAEQLEVKTVLTLGALLSEVPHSRPVGVIGTSEDPDMLRRFDLNRSRYEGPTGIVGVLHDSCRRAGLASASFWATVPTYVSGAPSPKAALALCRHVAYALQVPLATEELEIAAADYERQIDALIGEDDSTAAYVAGLEAEHDSDPDALEVIDELDDDEVPEDPAALIADIERFLRDQ